MARSLADRLRALQASVGAAPGPQVSETGLGVGAEVPVEGTPSTRDQVSGEPSSRPATELGLKSALGSMLGSAPVGSPHPIKDGHAPLLEGGFVWDESVGMWHRVVRSDILTLHGSSRYSDIFDCNLQGLARLAKVASLTPEKMRFYDTETTGLGTGAGTIPFLHAVGQFEEDEFVVHQYFLADYSGEAGLIEYMMKSHFSSPDTVVVSFNGKSFDWPLLRTRMTMYRLPNPSLDHVDLLYPSRRFWREKLPRVSLAQVEESVLGLTRTDDVPGKEAPARYFEFVADGDASRLMPIFEHNATDVCSLVTLAIHLSRTLEQGRDWGDDPRNGDVDRDLLTWVKERETGPSVELETASEWAALGRIYDEWRESDLAAHCFKVATLCPDATWREHWLRSLNAKRRGDWSSAVEIWEWMAAEYPWSLQPCVELAKAFEHRLQGGASGEDSRDRLDRALSWAKEARLRIKTWTSHGSVTTVPDERVIQALNHRIARIERKRAARNV